MISLFLILNLGILLEIQIISYDFDYIFLFKKKHLQLFVVKIEKYKIFEIGTLKDIH